MDRRSFPMVGCAFALACLMPFAPALAQPVPATLRAQAFAVPPLATEKDGVWTGFTIDLWEEIARRLNTKTTYQAASSVAVAFDALRSGQADVLVSGVFMTAERDREFDFSHTIMETGQQVMVRDAGGATALDPLMDLLQLLFSKTTLAWFALAALLVLIPAHIVWLIERKDKDGIIPTRKYFPGIFHAIHWSAGTLMSQSDRMPRHPLSRIVSYAWMFTSVVFIALYTAQLTSNLTVQQIRGAINGPEDLPGKRVGTLRGSISADYLRGHGAQVQEFVRLEDMYQALLDGKVDAVLLGAPPLHYYAAHEGKGLVKLVGPQFDKGDGGFAFPEGSALRRQVNTTLLEIKEDGTYQRLYDKWFGGE
jgi:polar amino acid transport system substrate-binding protein